MLQWSSPLAENDLWRDTFPQWYQIGQFTGVMRKGINKCIQDESERRWKLFLNDVQVLLKLLQRQKMIIMIMCKWNMSYLKWSIHPSSYPLCAHRCCRGLLEPGWQRTHPEQVSSPSHNHHSASRLTVLFTKLPCSPRVVQRISNVQNYRFWYWRNNVQEDQHHRHPSGINHFWPVSWANVWWCTLSPSNNVKLLYLITSDREVMFVSVG